MTGLQPGPDGRPRCPWATSADDYVAYHDDEWGVPVRDDRGLFERLTLEAFQSGLSWLTILRKRENFRAAFAGFELERVAAFGDADRARLMADAGIVRNHLKVDATLHNAKAICALREREGDDALTRLVWSFAPPPRPRPATLSDVPPFTDGSKALAKALKAEDVHFVGPTTAYALMQACGLVDDHLEGCCVEPQR